ncbi:MAG: CDP-alcohol phosphatidyltransferase family protein [Candidatus Bilamarchaeaceae archaeon]
MLKQKEKTVGLQTRIGKMLSFIPLTPNQLTIVAFLTSIMAAYAIITKELGYGLALFLVAGTLDAIDGAIARARGEITKFGGFLDGVCDRFVEALFLISLMFYPLPTIFIDAKIWLAVLIFIGTCMPSYIRAYADHHRVITHKEAKALGGLFERSERILLLAMGMSAGILVSMDYFIYSVILAIALSIITVAQRIIVVMKRQTR